MSCAPTPASICRPSAPSLPSPPSRPPPLRPPPPGRRSLRPPSALCPSPSSWALPPSAAPPARCAGGAWGVHGAAGLPNSTECFLLHYLTPHASPAPASSAAAQARRRRPRRQARRRPARQQRQRQGCREEVLSPGAQGWLGRAVKLGVLGRSRQAAELDVGHRCGMCAKQSCIPLTCDLTQVI